MKKRYIVLHRTATPQQREAMIAYFKRQRFAWWSWLGDSWLIREGSVSSSAKEIRDELVALMPGVHILVIELSGAGDTWSGQGPISEERNMFKWLRNFWKRVD